jgi:hypothetical protein
MHDSTALQTKEQVTLADLAVQINNEHHQAEAVLNAGLEHALEAGRLLRQAKKQISRGDWLPWLKENFVGSERTAQCYMRVASQFPKLHGKAQRVADLTFRGALAAVASNSQAIARKSPQQQCAALLAWEKHNCKNAHQALCRAERARDEARNVAARDPTIMAALDKVPTEKRRAVVEWVEEQYPDKPITAAAIRKAAAELAEQEPDDESDDLGTDGAGDRAAADDVQLGSVEEASTELEALVRKWIAKHAKPVCVAAAMLDNLAAKLRADA